MRFLGFTLIAIGVATIALVLSIHGGSGGTLRYVAIAVASIGAGARFVKAGRSRNVMPASEGRGSRDSTAEGDIEIPMTPEVASVIDGAIAKLNRSFVRASAGFLALGQILGTFLYLTTTPRMFWSYFLGAGIGAAAMLTVGLVWIFKDKQRRRDQRELTYIRTTGPVELVWIRSNYHVLRLGGQSFRVDEKGVVPALESLDWASIDYSRHMHVIFEVRDRSGESVYSCEGYQRPGLQRPRPIQMLPPEEPEHIDRCPACARPIDATESRHFCVECGEPLPTMGPK